MFYGSLWTKRKWFKHFTRRSRSSMFSLFLPNDCAYPLFWKKKKILNIKIASPYIWIRYGTVDEMRSIPSPKPRTSQGGKPVPMPRKGVPQAAARSPTSRSVTSRCSTSQGWDAVARQAEGSCHQSLFIYMRWITRLTMWIWQEGQKEDSSPRYGLFHWFLCFHEGVPRKREKGMSIIPMWSNYEYWCVINFERPYKLSARGNEVLSSLV